MFTFPFTLFGGYGLQIWESQTVFNLYNTSTGHGDAGAGVTFNTDGTTTRRSSFGSPTGPIWLRGGSSSDYWLYTHDTGSGTGASIFPGGGWHHMNTNVQVAYERTNTTTGDFNYSWDVFIVKSVSMPVTTPTIGSPAGATYVGTVSSTVSIVNND